MKLRLLFTALMCAILLAGYSQITSVGLIGTSTPGGWDTDTDMIQDGTDADVWTLSITLTEGVAKFRADDDWAVNWGAEDFPAGIGTQGGPDIPIFAGDYEITFNSATGEYNFAVSSPIGIIGDATPGGWDNDTNMYKDTTEHGYFVILDLVEGGAKFRKDDDWAVNWGSLDFPVGTGTQDGDNIPVSPAGTYHITLDTMSGAYTFTQIITFESISLNGTATSDLDAELVQDSGDPNVWSANLEFVDGTARFRGNNDWAINWGSADFPTGTGVQDGEEIPIGAGLYKVTFNTESGEYSFLPVTYYTTIGLIGDATPGGWDADTDMELDAGSQEEWTIRMEFTTGEAKFRADNDWAANWGSGDFPTGIAAPDGANIPVPEGEYLVKFNTTTLEYSFTEIIVFETVGIIGTGSPTAGWDDDTDMIKDTEDEHHWFMTSVDLFDGEIKFRAEDDWAVNWGLDSWPAGIGEQDGPNILSVAGTYGVTLYSNTGEYAFGAPVSTKEELLNPADVDVFPNPVGELLNVDLSKLQLGGDITLTVLDINGRKIMTNTMSASSSIQLDVAGLQNGNYILQINSSDYIIGKRFTVAK
jgi:hypothetical protein